MQAKLRSGDAGGSFAAPTAEGGDGLRVLTLRPRRSLALTVGIPAVIILIPIIGLLAWHEQQSSPGLGTSLLWGALILVAVIGYVVFRFRRTEIAVSPYGIVERGFFGTTHSIAVRDISSVVRVDLYRGASDETVPQLFVVGRDGRCLVRMRGLFWEPTDMDLVAQVLDIEESVRPEPVSAAELHATDPKLLFWFERPFIG